MIVNYQVLQGDSLAVLRDMDSDSVNCCVTSPPYWGLRDYGVAGQIGLESTPDAFVSRLVEVFREVRRVLKTDGTCWVNLGDSYASTGGDLNKRKPGFSITGHQSLVAANGAKPGNRTPPAGLKPKDLCGIPWRVAFALQADGWWLRQDIIWHKPNPMPESVRDRCTKAHEYVFLLAKAERYWWDMEAMKEASTYAGCVNSFENKNAAARVVEKLTGNMEAGVSYETKPTRNRRSVWTMATQATPEAHFATFPLELPEMCLRAGCPVDGVVLDPFNGAGTTGLAALKNGRRYIGIELNPSYIEITHERFQKHMPLLAVTV